jgi:hypothetical protein
VMYRRVLLFINSSKIIVMMDKKKVKSVKK